MKKPLNIHIELDISKNPDSKDYTLKFDARMLRDDIGLALTYLLFCFKDRMNVDEEELHDIMHKANDASEELLEQHMNERLSEL